MKTEDFSWCNDSGYSDVFNNSLCECTAPQVNDGMCICGRPINDNMTNTLKQNLELRKALAEVDRLTSENVSLDYINSEQDKIIKELKNQIEMFQAIHESETDSELDKNN
tara:strand:- start:107 stop:436 length:330 start_codon:yes stop_codon:yes gene_type:complete